MADNNGYEHSKLQSAGAENSPKPDVNTVFDTSVFVVDFTKVLKKFWYIVVILAVLAGGATAYLKNSGYTPMYRSSVSFSVSTINFATNGSSVYSSYYDNSSAAQLSKTFPYIVNTSIMRNALLNELKKSYINGTITASAVTEDSNIFKLTVSSNSPEDAFDIVNAVIAVYPDVARYVTGNVRLNILIEPTFPDEPYTTNNIFRTTAIMAFIGAVLGLGIIAVFAFFKNTLRKKEDIKNKLNQKCLVEVPYVEVHRKSKNKSDTDKVIRITGRHSIFKESFRLLRRRLLKNMGQDEKIIAVTASAENEGKTIVALNLAHTIAIAGKKTALVDMDFGRDNLKRYLSAKNTDIPDFTVITSKNRNSFARAEYHEDKKLSVFFSGAKGYKPKDGEFDAFFRYLRDNFDYIIVNTSPGASVADTVSVCNLCDCIIVTAKQDYTSIDKIRRTLEYLSYSTAKIKGFVFNGVAEGFSGYGGYNYGGKYGYGKHGYGRYGYGRYGYGRHYGSYGEYVYGDEIPKEGSGHIRLFGKKPKSDSDENETDIPDSEIPDNNAVD